MKANASEDTNANEENTKLKLEQLEISFRKFVTENVNLYFSLEH